MWYWHCTILGLCGTGIAQYLGYVVLAKGTYICPCKNYCIFCFILSPGIDANMSAVSEGNDMTVCFDAERAAKFECRLNGGPWETCKPVNY